MPSTTPPPRFARTISAEEMAALPIRRYEGEVHVVASPAALEHALADIRAERVLGFDTETRPVFRKGESHPPSLAQLATARAVYLLALQRLDCSAALGEILAAHAIVKIGVGLAEDMRQLKLFFAAGEGSNPASFLDAGALARRHGVKQTGLRNLAGIFLGFRVPKGKRTSNWAAVRLSPAQIAYAATDAWVCRELFLCFEQLGLLGADGPA